MDILFQFGEFTIQGSTFVSDLTVALIGAAVGGVIAAGVAILMYKRQRVQEFDETLFYILLLLRSVEDELKTDVANINEFISDVNTNSSELPLLKQKASYDIKRLVERIDQYRGLIAYIQKGGDQTKFKELYSILDFYNEVMIQIREQLSKEKNFDYQRKLELTKITDRLQDEIYFNQGELNEKHNQLFVKMQPIFDSVKFEEDKTKDVKFWNENFIVPLRKIFDEHKNVYTNSWSWDLSKAQTIYKEIEVKNKLVGKAFAEYVEILKAQPGKLERHETIIKALLPKTFLKLLEQSSTDSI